MNTEFSQKQTKTFLPKLKVDHPDWQIGYARFAQRHYQFFKKSHREVNIKIEQSKCHFLAP